MPFVSTFTSSLLNKHSYHHSSAQAHPHVLCVYHRVSRMNDGDDTRDSTNLLQNLRLT